MIPTSFTYINRALKLIKFNKTSELSISTTFGTYLYISYFSDETEQFFDNCFYQLKTTNDNYLYSKKDLIKLLLKYELICIEVYGYIDKKYIDEIIYFFQYKYANIIQSGYRKYKIRTARIRNDLVIRGLTEHWFHPSKINFNV